MKGRAPAVIAAGCATAALTAVLFSIGLYIASPALLGVGFPSPLWALPSTALALIGALLIWRRSANLTGWVLAAGGLLMVGNALAQDYARFAYSAAPPRFGAATASWLGLWTWSSRFSTDWLPSRLPSWFLEAKRMHSASFLCSRP